MIESPRNSTVEQMVLASMAHSEQAREQAVGGLTENSFYAKEHRQIFTELKTCHLKGFSPDFSLVEQSIGGSARENLPDIWWNTSSFPSIEPYIKKLVTTERLRGVLGTVNDINRTIELSTLDGDYTEALEDVERHLSVVRDEVGGSSHLQPASKLGGLALQAFNGAQNGKNVGILTGIDDVDYAIGGLMRKEYAVIAGRSGMGKSSLALSMMLKMAKRGVCVGLFSLEMPTHKVMNRLVMMQSNTMDSVVTGRHIRGSDKADAKVCTSYSNALDDVMALPIYIDDSSLQSTSSIESSVRTFVRKNNLSAVFIDYMSYVRSSSNKQRNEVVSDISKDFQSMFKRLDVSGVVLVQLTRDAQNQQPTLSNLKESGQIENDADVIIAIHRPKPDEKSDVDLIVLKARDGGEGHYPTHFCEKTTQFRSMSSGEKELYKQSKTKQEDIKF